MILAHIARGFNMHHTIDGLNSLRGLKNVYFDTAAVTESGAIEHVLRDPDFGPSRVLYGSDFPVTHIRGRCVGVGDSFYWISPSSQKLKTGGNVAGSADLRAVYAEHGEIQTALVGVEAMRALKLACDNTGLTRREVEMIMHGNAERMFGIGCGDSCKDGDRAATLIPGVPDIFLVRCASLGRIFHSKIPFGSHACSLEAIVRGTNGIPLGSSLLLPVGTVNSVQTLKVTVAKLAAIAFLI
jgi:glutamate-1-semialdehyde 2,1-aminomutase